MTRSLGFLLAGLVLCTSAARAQGADSLGLRAQRDSNDALLHYEAARAYWKKKRWDDAERHLRQAVLVAPEYAEAYLALGEVPFVRGDDYWKKFVKARGREAFDSVIAEYTVFARRAFLINPLVDLDIWGEVDFGQDGSYGAIIRAIWWAKGYRKGANLLHQGRDADAFAVLDTLMHDARAGVKAAEAPDILLFYHGLAAARIKRYDDAIQDFAILTGRSVHREKEIEQERGFSRYQTNDLRYMLATMLFLAGRPRQATPVFQRVLEIDLGMYPAHVQLARMHEAAGELDRGIAERELAVAAYPQDATLQYELAGALLRGGRTDEAIGVLRQAMTVNPRDHQIPFLLGETLMAVGRDQEAKAPYEHFLAIAPERLSQRADEVRRTVAQIP